MARCINLGSTFSIGKLSKAPKLWQTTDLDVGQTSQVVVFFNKAKHFYSRVNELEPKLAPASESLFLPKLKFRC